MLLVGGVCQRDCRLCGARGPYAPWDMKHAAVSLLSVSSQWSLPTTGTPDQIYVVMGSRAKHQHREHHCSGFPFACRDHSTLPTPFHVSKGTSSVPLRRDNARNALQAVVTWKISADCFTISIVSTKCLIKACRSGSKSSAWLKVGVAMIPFGKF